MSKVKGSSKKKRSSESEALESEIKKRVIVEDDFDPKFSNDIRGIVAALKQIKEKAQKDGQKKNEENCFRKVTFEKANDSDEELKRSKTKLRCKCNFHALKFVPKIQEADSLLIKRIRKSDVSTTLDKELLGDLLSNVHLKNHDSKDGPREYLALHLRFEIDMVAYSLYEFGGGESEKRELQAYREIHFPLLIERLKSLKPISAEELRRTGRCPLPPEEAALVLASLGFKRDTSIYFAG